MFEEIEIGEISCFSDYAKISSLTRVNLMFGPNGSGKTSISRRLASISENPEAEHAADRVLVYNKDYRKSVLSRSRNIPGVFTLGEKAAEVEDRIETLEKDIKSTRDKIDTIIRRLGESLEGEVDPTSLRCRKSDSDDRFSSSASSVKKSIDASILRLLIPGEYGTKEKFSTYLKTIASKYKGISKEEHERKVRSIPDIKSILDSCKSLEKSKGGEIQTELDAPTWKTNWEELNDSMAAPIVASSDSYIKSLLESAGSESWFREGLNYYSQDHENCPFCFQGIEQDRRLELSSIFDDHYTRALEFLEEQLNNVCEDIDQEFLIVSNYVDSWERSFSQEVTDLRARSLESMQKLREAVTKKIETPKEVSEEGLPLKTRDYMARLADQINIEVRAWNFHCENWKDERDALKEDFAAYLVFYLFADLFDSYFTEQMELNKEEAGLRRGLVNKRSVLEEKENELKDLVATRLTSQRALQSINSLLERFSGDSFSLADPQNTGEYCIVRSDGSAVDDDLSEGEEQLIAFLYFWTLVDYLGRPGSEVPSDGVVVVVDDPMSSLDSGNFYAVSSITRTIIERAISGLGSIGQCIVLTHNPAFFHEISHIRKGNKEEVSQYAIEKKNFGENTVVRSESSPVRSTYDGLWEVVRRSSCNPSSADSDTVPNAMRRILENYFSLGNGVDLSQLDFPESDVEPIFRAALTSWANSGSHGILDEVYYCSNDDDIIKYHSAFKELFSQTGNSGHYDMMMAQ